MHASMHTPSHFDMHARRRVDSFFLDVRICMCIRTVHPCTSYAYLSQVSARPRTQLRRHADMQKHIHAYQIQYMLTHPHSTHRHALAFAYQAQVNARTLSHLHSLSVLRIPDACILHADGSAHAHARVSNRTHTRTCAYACTPDQAHTHVKGAHSKCGTCRRIGIHASKSACTCMHACIALVCPCIHKNACMHGPC